MFFGDQTTLCAHTLYIHPLKHTAKSVYKEEMLSSDNVICVVSTGKVKNTLTAVIINRTNDLDVASVVLYSPSYAV